MNRILAAVIGFVVVAFIVRASTFIVDQRQSAIVYQLGQITRVVTEPGLYFRVPLLQNVEYQDRRILTLDTPVTDRVQTSEKKNLLIDSFVKWRIVDPRLFRVSFPAGERSAEDRIGTLVRDALNQAVNKRTVNEITSRERDRAMEEIRASVQERGLPRRAEAPRRRRCQGVGALCAILRSESGVRALLSQPRGVSVELPQPQ
jgi:membrane protease subunit HflC